MRQKLKKKKIWQKIQGLFWQETFPQNKNNSNKNPQQQQTAQQQPKTEQNKPINQTNQPTNQNKWKTLKELGKTEQWSLYGWQLGQAWKTSTFSEAQSDIQAAIQRSVEDSKCQSVHYL